jgi:hypothetical protein
LAVFTAGTSSGSRRILSPRTAALSAATLRRGGRLATARIALVLVGRMQPVMMRAHMFCWCNTIIRVSGLAMLSQTELP